MFFIYHYAVNIYEFPQFYITFPQLFKFYIEFCGCFVLRSCSAVCRVLVAEDSTQWCYGE